ncbi:MAG: hypothetical protein LUG98_04990 [Tannerellaceae bacterium]|nr:hypothetical protein [Tannerellaceae bacterium]
MKHILFYLFLLGMVLSSCNNREKEARAYLDQARLFYEQGELNGAKNQIDSLRTNYKDIVALQQEGLELMRLVEIKESARTIAFCDSLLPLKLMEAEELKEGFVLEKDPEFQEIGNYVWKQQTVERNVMRCYVRSRVNERGEMFLESVFFGNRPVNHSFIRVSIPDGQFADTDEIPYDGGLNYRFEDMGNTTEVVTYSGEAGVDVVKFIYAHPEERIKVEYKGDKPYTIYLTDTDKKSIVATYDLATVLNDIETMRNSRNKAQQRIAYLRSKL